MMATQSNYPLPPSTGPPEQQHQFSSQHYQQFPSQPQPPPPPPPQKQYVRGASEKHRPRSRAFSFRSDKSQKSATSHNHKIQGAETHEEKEAKRLHSKADPTLAMNEAEPCSSIPHSNPAVTPPRDPPSVMHTY